uniref:Uncharacterized protein n=1 Tax=Bos indicus x Bos taurus TaxID=30522 RepID=A0A4W2CZ58_BOBOX
MECVNQSISVVWCSRPWSPVRMSAGRSVFYVDPPAFVNPSVNPPSLERVPVMVANCSLCPLLVILELSTDSVAFIMNNVCDLTILPQFSKQVL